MLLVRDPGTARISRPDLYKKVEFRSRLINWIKFLYKPDRRDCTISGSLNMSIFQKILAGLLMLKEFGENLD